MLTQKKSRQPSDKNPGGISTGHQSVKPNWGSPLEHNIVECLKWGRTANLREAQGMLYSSPSDSEHSARSSQSTRRLPL